MDRKSSTTDSASLALSGSVDPSTKSNAGDMARSFNAAPYLSAASFWSPQYLVSSAWLQHAPFAFWITSVLKPRSIVELGTHNAFSYFAFCQAVQAVGLETRCFAIDTWKGDEHAGFYGEDVFDGVNTYNDLHYSAFSQLVRSPFDDALAHFPDSSIDLLHIDGRHFYEDARHDFESWVPKLSERAVVLFHDTNVRERGFGVFKIWAELAQRRPSFEFFHGHGLGVLGHGIELPDILKSFFAASGERDTATSIRTAYSRLGGAVQAEFEVGVAKSRLAQSEAVTASLSADLEARTHEVANFQAELGAGKAEAANLEKELDASKCETANVRSELRVRYDEIRGLNEQLSNSKAERIDLLAQNSRLQVQLGAKAQALQAVYASTSWKLAMPLRVLKRGGIRLGKTAGRLLGRAKAGGSRVTSGDAERVRNAFDPAYYMATYPDLRDSGVDPFEHYMQIGWRQGRDPSPDFCTTYYLRHASDVAAADINPFEHWVLHGIRETRRALPFQRSLARIQYAPKVSAIVPNYNHARFLPRRIDSILAQTYSNLEILILDDCSTDESSAIIERYRQDHPDRIRTLFNSENSGNVFRQWRKGVEHTDGEIVWICESDDFCEPDFLEHLVPSFRDGSINLAFGRIQETDQSGNANQRLDDYREKAEPGIWQHRLVRPSCHWFANAFGVSNVIANVGGSLWRRAKLADAVWREAQTYTVVGDWYLYSQIAGGGQIVWEPKATSYFRRHAESTAMTSFARPLFYKELERFMLNLRRQWRVPPGTVEKFHNIVAEQYNWLGLQEKWGPIQDHCDKQKILSGTRTRPHILIAFYGFIPGGGEVFPLNLANALQANGWLVSMLSFEMENVNVQMRAALDPAIPVYDVAWVDEYGADRFIAEAGISLIHSHTLGAEFNFFERWRIETRIPYLATLHGSYEASDLTDDRVARLAAGVSHFVYTADKNLEPLRFLQLPPSTFTKLPNAMPFDPLPFPKTREELGIAADAVVFTFIARGIPSKGWGASIAAFGRLREKHAGRPLHLLLVGEGEETDRLFAMHGSDPDITFLGYQSRIHGLYRISDVAIVPTRFSGESFPLCIIQALQVGVPVVAARMGEIEAMIVPPDENAAGILIDAVPNDDAFVRSLESAMEVMLSPVRRSEYAAAARKLGEGYSMDKLVGVYGSLYERMLAEPDRSAVPRRGTALAQ